MVACYLMGWPGEGEKIIPIIAVFSKASHATSHGGAAPNRAQKPLQKATLPLPVGLARFAIYESWSSGGS